jgi:hypothetical protein
LKLTKHGGYLPNAKSLAEVTFRSFPVRLVEPRIKEKPLGGSQGFSIFGAHRAVFLAGEQSENFK